MALCQKARKGDEDTLMNPRLFVSLSRTSDFLIYHNFLYDAFASNLPDLVGFSVSTLHFYKIYHSTEVKHTRKNKKYLRLYAR